MATGTLTPTLSYFFMTLWTSQAWSHRLCIYPNAMQVWESVMLNRDFTLVLYIPLDALLGLFLVDQDDHHATCKKDTLSRSCQTFWSLSLRMTSRQHVKKTLYPGAARLSAVLLHSSEGITPHQTVPVLLSWLDVLVDAARFLYWCSIPPTLACTP